MSMPHGNKPLLFALAILLLACVPAWGGAVDGVTADAANHQGNFVPGNLVDGNPATAWVGGGKGVGPGKWIELTFPAPVKLEALTIATGHQGRFNAFRRMTRGVIIYPDETRQKFTLKSQTGVQRIPLQPKVADSLKIIITGVDPSTGDKGMGDAKVAVSEIAVFGRMDESLAAAPAVNGEDAAVEEPPADAQPEKAAEAEAKPAPAPEAKPEAEPEPKAKAEPEPAPKAKPKAEPKPEPKAEPAPAPAKAAPAPQPAAEEKPAPKPAPQKSAQKSAKKSAKKSAPKKKASAKPSPAKGADTITRLRPAVEISPDKDLAVGVISPWLDLELVAEIKRYLGLLTTLHDSYPELFVPAIRERERAAFLQLQESMRAKHEFGGHHIAMLEHIGLSFDKPVIQGDKATVRVHGPYRYYIENKAYEFQVDADVTLVHADGRWLIEDVKDR